VDAVKAPRRAGDPSMLVAQPGLAADLLGWVPEFSSLDTIVNSALRWHKQQRAEKDKLAADARTA
jgi:UDP-glucose 4-epimerase